MAETTQQLTEMRQRAEADPNDEIAHFSLGRALLDANEPAEAGDCCKLPPGR